MVYYAITTIRNPQNSISSYLGSCIMDLQKLSGNGFFASVGLFVDLCVFSAGFRGSNCGATQIFPRNLLFTCDERGSVPARTQLIRYPCRWTNVWRREN